ncbi:MAG: glycosyltransferase family 39 protein [Streptosporangiaceae bacterium]
MRTTWTSSAVGLARDTPPPAGPAGPAGIPARARKAARRFWPDAVPWVAALAGVAAMAAYLVIALSRLTYPFPIEWLESNSLIEVHRILAGRQLYPAPSIGYVPDGYPPLYFIVSAAVAKVLGGSYLPLRLVSLTSSLACFGLLADLIRRETASARAGIAAAGLLAATYFVAGAWFDIGRVDSLFLAFSVAALYAARRMRRARGAVGTGLLLAAAFGTKQTGLAEGVAVLAALALGPRRMLALQAGLTYGAVLAVSTAVLGFASHGWYLYYVFVQMSEHTLNYIELGWFWTRLLLPALGIACGAAVLGARRADRVLLAGCIALLAESAATLLHSGANRNDMMPAYLAVALLAGLGMGRAAAERAGYVPWRRHAEGPDGPARPILRWGPLAAGLLIAAQTVLLLSGFHPGRVVPPGSDRAAGQQLVAGLRALGGTTADFSDPGLDLAAGLPAVAHQGAADDVLRASGTGLASYERSVDRAVTEQRFSAFITDFGGAPRGFPPDLARYYRRCPQRLQPGPPGAVFESVVGPLARPAFVWLPVGRGSCAVTIRTLDGTPDGGSADSRLHSAG